VQVQPGLHVQGEHVHLALPHPPSVPQVQDGPHVHGEQVQPGFSQTAD